MRRFLAFAALVFALPAYSTPMFVPLGDLPGGAFQSSAAAVSADGSTVVGISVSAPNTSSPFRWTSSEGMVAIDPLGFQGLATDVSADGSVVVGGTQSLSPEQAYRWTSETGIEGLGVLPERSDFSTAFGVSGDGSTVVGVSTGGLPLSDDEAFRWTSDGSMVSLGFLPGGDMSQAYAISADGSIIVGTGRNGSSYNEAFRWTSESGMVGLGFLPGGFYSGANGVSADGTIIVGASDNASGNLAAFRWTNNGGMVDLGFLPGTNESSASSVSADGSIIVGSSRMVGGSSPAVAFLWDSTHGMRSLQEVLTDLGVDLTGWQLTGAADISADGNTIAGFGWNPSGQLEAWVAVLAVPEPRPGMLAMAGIVVLAVWRRRRA